MRRLADEICKYDGEDRGGALHAGPLGYPVYVLDRDFTYWAGSGPIANGSAGDSAWCVIVNMGPADTTAGPGESFGFSADEAREFACAIITAANNFERFGAEWPGSEAEELDGER